MAINGVSVEISSIAQIKPETLGKPAALASVMTGFCQRYETAMNGRQQF
jgi:hypothetical protein